MDPAIEVQRAAAVGDLAAAVQNATAAGGTIIATGSPGQGKSWACQQLIDQLTGEGWIVAEHYCYLGDAWIASPRCAATMLGRSATALCRSDVHVASCHRLALHALGSGGLTLRYHRPTLIAP